MTDIDSASPVELCNTCGAPLVAGANFCAFCGASVRGGATPAGPPPAFRLAIPKSLPEIVTYSYYAIFAAMVIALIPGIALLSLLIAAGMLWLAYTKRGEAVGTIFASHLQNISLIARAGLAGGILSRLLDHGGAVALTLLIFLVQVFLAAQGYPRFGKGQPMEFKLR
jgi:hypothetical protein